MRALFRRWRRSRFSYEPLIEVRISKKRLLDNLKKVRGACGNVSVSPVLKSNAYGHGLSHVASILDQEKCPFFIVDSYYEALVLRNEGISTPLLVIGYTRPELIARSRLANVSFTITSRTQWEELLCIGVSSPRTIHVKIDTGMHRQGMTEKDASEVLECIGHEKNVILEGVCSHFADADGEDEQWTRKQIERWENCVREVRSRFPTVQHLHISATAGIHTLPRITCTTVRCGIGLFGVMSEGRSIQTQPVLELRSRITSLRRIGTGEAVGYNVTWKATRDTLLATIPVGYYEGLDRRLSNVGCVSVRGMMCPIVGRVSMNIASIDVTDVSGAREGDKVVVISNNAPDQHSIVSMARMCQTIPYEILVHIPSTLRRAVVDE